MSGWIKLHRKIKEKAFSRNPDYFSVWVHCLLNANHEKIELLVNGKTMPINPGSFITSRLKMSQQCGVQQSKIERVLEYLKTEQQIEQVNLTTCRLISITNWKKYQIIEQQVELVMNSERTPNEHRMNTNKNGKNTKNEKKEKKEATTSGEVCSADSPQASAVFSFQVVGFENGKHVNQWPLTQDKLQEYQDSYPNLDVLAEFRHAAQWCRDNPRQRKTCAGMPKFLNNWLTRATNSGSRTQPQGGRLSFDQQKTKNTLDTVRYFEEQENERKRKATAK